MNDKNEKIIITNLESYRPMPGSLFYKRMAESPWHQKQPASRFVFIHRFAIGFVAFLIVAIALSVSIPSVRAAVLKYLGLAVSSSESIPNPAIPVESLVDNQKVDEITNLAGWKIKVPTWLPEGYQFHDAQYVTTNKMVLLNFYTTRQLPGNDPTVTETKAITMIQALHNDVLPLMVAPSTIVHDISINGQPAAYAVGAWENDIITGQATWNSAYGLKNIYWQIDNIFLTLNTNDALISQDELLRIAENTR